MCKNSIIKNARDRYVQMKSRNFRFTVPNKHMEIRKDELITHLNGKLYKALFRGIPKKYIKKAKELREFLVSR